MTKQIDPRLLGKQKEPKQKDPPNVGKIDQLVYTIPQLAQAMPGISRQTIQTLIDSGDIRAIPAGGLNQRYITIPRVTLEEDLRNLVAKYA